VTTVAPSAPAPSPAAPSPPARTLLAQLTGSKGGQAISVTLEQTTSAAATVFLTITTDGEAAPPEKFLGVQKARANARLLAIKQQLDSPKLERFDEPEPEPEPPPRPASAGSTGKVTGKPTSKATGKITGKAAPATPTAPVRTRDQVTIIKELGRYQALMIVGPASRYEVWKDRGLPTAHLELEIKATRAWQPQQRAAKAQVDELYAADPSPRPAPEPSAPPASPAVAAPEPEPPAATAPAPEPAPPAVAAPASPAVASVPELPAARPAAKPAPKARTPKVRPAARPDDDGPAL
jgi:hypothetical protein